MTAYLLSLFSAAMAVALVGLLAPGSSGRALKLACGLFLICVIALPLPSWLGDLRDSLGEITAQDPANGTGTDYEEQLQEALDSASRSYFAAMLTQMLEDRFSIPQGELRCAILWEESEEMLRPQRVTLILSGSAVWKDPAEMEEFVSGLLGCECVSAIE